MAKILIPYNDQNSNRTILLGLQTIRDFGTMMSFEELGILLKTFSAGNDIICEVPDEKRDIIKIRLADQKYIFRVID